MNYQDLINLYLEDYYNNNRHDYINKHASQFQTKGLNGVKDWAGRISKYGNYLNKAGNYLSKSNNNLINSVGNKISSFGNNLSQTAGKVNDFLNTPNNLINNAKNTAIAKAGTYFQKSEIPLAQKIGSGLSTIGGAGATAGTTAATTAGTTAGTTAATTAGTTAGTTAAASGGAAAGGATSGAAAVGPWAAVAALAVMALEGTNRKRAASGGESLMGDNLKNLAANKNALEQARKSEEEQLLQDMYSKYGWIN